MKTLALFAVVVLVVLILSVDCAVAARWSTEINGVSATPGALLPTLPPRCGVMSLSGTPEELADWLEDFLGPMTAEEIDGVLDEVDPEGELGVTGEDLHAMTHEELVLAIATLENENNTLYLELLQVADTVNYVPCKKTKHQGVCEDGYKCQTWTCTRQGGGTGSCTEGHYVYFDWSWGACPHMFEWWTYYCSDPCYVPLDKWTLCAGVALATGLFLASRRRIAIHR